MIQVLLRGPVCRNRLVGIFISQLVETEIAFFDDILKAR